MDRSCWARLARSSPAYGKFLTGDSGQRNTDFMKRLTSLTERTRKAASADEIEALEGEIEEAFSSYLEAQAKGQIELDRFRR